MTTIVYIFKNNLPEMIASLLTLLRSLRATSLSILMGFAVLTIGSNHSLAIEKPSLSESIEIALDYIEIGRHQEAVGIMNTNIKFNPKDSDSYYIRGLAKLGQSQIVSAIEDFNKSILLTSNNFLRHGSHLMRAKAHGTIGNYENSTSDWKEVIRLDPTNSRNYNGEAYWMIWAGHNIQKNPLPIDQGCFHLEKAKELGYTKPFSNKIMREFC